MRLPQFSRPRRATGFGKNLVPAKTMLPPEIRVDLDAKVRSEGFETLADWLRDVCIAKVKCITALRSVADRRLDSVAAIVPEKDR